MSRLGWRLVAEQDVDEHGKVIGCSSLAREGGDLNRYDVPALGGA